MNKRNDLHLWSFFIIRDKMYLHINTKEVSQIFNVLFQIIGKIKEMCGKRSCEPQYFSFSYRFFDCANYFEATPQGLFYWSIDWCRLSYIQYYSWIFMHQEPIVWYKVCIGENNSKIVCIKFVSNILMNQRRICHTRTQDDILRPCVVPTRAQWCCRTESKSPFHPLTYQVPKWL